MLPMARMKVVLHHSLPWVLWACCAPQASQVDQRCRSAKATEGQPNDNGRAYLLDREKNNRTRRTSAPGSPQAATTRTTPALRPRQGCDTARRGSGSASAARRTSPSPRPPPAADRSTACQAEPRPDEPLRRHRHRLRCCCSAASTRACTIVSPTRRCLGRQARSAAARQPSLAQPSVA